MLQMADDGVLFLYYILYNILLTYVKASQVTYFTCHVSVRFECATRSIRSEDAEATKAAKAVQHQFCLLDAAIESNLLGTSSPQMPSVVKPKELVAFANRNCLLDDANSFGQDTGLDLVPHEGVQRPTDLVTNAAGCSQAASFLSKKDHGHALHGLGDGEFAISEKLVEKALAEVPGFVSKTNACFQSEHNQVIKQTPFELAPQDELENIHCCQLVCGRYCRDDIKNASLLHRAIDMMKSICRIMAAQRDIRTGRLKYLSPSCKLPVILVKNARGVHARLVCRVSLNPLEVDLQHCSVHQIADASYKYKVVLQFQCFMGSSLLCPLVDSMTECAIWFSHIWDDTSKCELVMDYELDPISDHVILVKHHHKTYVEEAIGHNSFQSLLDSDCASKAGQNQDPEEAALLSAGNIVSRLNSGSKRKRNSKDKSANASVSFLPAVSKKQRGTHQSILSAGSVTMQSDLGHFNLKKANVPRKPCDYACVSLCQFVI